MDIPRRLTKGGVVAPQPGLAMMLVPDLWQSNMRVHKSRIFWQKPREMLCLTWEDRSSFSWLEPIRGLKRCIRAHAWRVTWSVFPHTRWQVGQILPSSSPRSGRAAFRKGARPVNRGDVKPLTSDMVRAYLVICFLKSSCFDRADHLTNRFSASKLVIRALSHTGK